MSESMLENLTNYYAKHHFNGSLDEIQAMSKRLQKDVLDEAYLLISETELQKAREKAKSEVKTQKQKWIRRAKLSLVVETLFVAFFVGIIVNQITSWISTEFSVVVVILSLFACAFLVAVVLWGQTG